MDVRFNPLLVAVSVLIAILHSYVAFDLASRLGVARRRTQVVLVLVGGLALGIGIWSMHFVGMFAMVMPGMRIGYWVDLVVASFFIAAANSGLALYLFTRRSITGFALLSGALAMALAISGMHYVAMYSMHMDARIEWSPTLVAASVLVAFAASYAALRLSRDLNRKYAEWLRFAAPELDGRWMLLRGSIYLGLAISGMHYTGMMAATFVHATPPAAQRELIVSTPTLSLVVAGMSVLTLAISITIGQLDRSLAFSAARLRKERELRSHFVSAVVHDLRNPLSAAILSVKFIERKSETEALRRHTRTAIGNLRRMEELVQTLLDAQLISTGQPLPVHLERVDLGQLLATTVDGLSSIYGARFQLECTQRIDGEWDARFLRRAIENLCTNAVKYGARDVPIRVRAALAPSTDNVSIAVQNGGEPLENDERRALFELFQRGRRAERSGESGWGLGLTIVKGVAEAHGGHVDVESSHALGTVFTLELPRHPSDAKLPAAAETERHPRRWWRPWRLKETPS